jgi:PAS domain S-box-containing protein
MAGTLFNAELLASAFPSLRGELTASKAFIDSLAVPLFVLDDSKILLANNSAVHLTGYSLDQLSAMSFWDLVHPSFRAIVRETECARLREEDTPVQYAFKILTQRNEERWVEFAALLLSRDDAKAVIGTAHALTERSTTAEEAIRESEERYRVILQSISDEVIIVDEAGTIETINDAVVSRIYLPLTSVMVDTSLNVLFPEDFAQRRLRVIQQVIHGKAPRQIEEKLTLAETAIWFSTKINPLFDVDGSCSKAVVVSRDITIEKERERFLRSFSKSILAAQEEERSRVARELHDGLAQRLAVLRLDLRRVEKEITPGQDDVTSRMTGAIESVNSLIDETRRIAQNLTPAILEDIGLTSAIQKILREFSGRTDITVQWDLIDLDGLFSPAEEIHFYRIIQEVINNIERHARAGNVVLAIRKNEHSIEFIIKDDGIGFDVQRAVASSSWQGDHRGLRGLQERARLVNGEFAISSITGKGTSVSLTVPIADKQ